ncbi:MAG: GTPase [Bacilli bacterium]|nr:GTPase [Bacilli bacterium]
MAFPVFIINGFLDSGKTTFIIDTLKNDGFHKQGNTLLLVCEEGEVEYNKKELIKYNVHIETFEDVDSFNVDKLYELTEVYHPDRIVIESNTMWDLNQVKFPSTFQVAQIVSFIDFTTFGVYYNNMRQMFVDNLRFSDLVVINRCENPEDLAQYQTSLKLINGNAQWIAMNSKGEVQEAFETPLPYDIEQDIIEIKDEDYARWYIDTFDHKERYEGKTVQFNALVLRSRKLPKETGVVGRYALTCCDKDMQFYGHLCVIKNELKIKSKTWVRVVALIKYEYSEEYEEDEVVLYPLSIEKIKEIDEPILNLR